MCHWNVLGEWVHDMGWPRKWRWDIDSVGERGVSTTAEGLMSTEQVLVKLKLVHNNLHHLPMSMTAY